MLASSLESVASCSNLTVAGPLEKLIRDSSLRAFKLEGSEQAQAGRSIHRGDAGGAAFTVEMQEEVRCCYGLI